MNSELNFDAVAERLKQAFKVRTDGELAGLLGISVTSYSNRKRSGSIPFEEICRAFITRRMNINWVLTGEGSPYIEVSALNEWIAPVAEIDQALLGEIAGELYVAFHGGHELVAREEAMHAHQQGALAARIFNKVAFIKKEVLRSAMIRDQAAEVAAISRLMSHRT